MRLAIFSDIHSNWEALETAVAHAGSQQIDRYIVLGDSVGYGASPNECFEWVVKNAAVSILGNHEKAVLDLGTREWFNPLAYEAIVWTAGKMDEVFKKAIPHLPYLRIEKNVTFAHGSPDQVESYRYLLNFEDARPSFRVMGNPVCFVGHTHVPACFMENACSATQLQPGILLLEKKERYILNPGSVGQPRDRDPRLSYGIFDEEKYTFEIVRLPYDNEKAAQKIRRAGLPAYLADRLL